MINQQIKHILLMVLGVFMFVGICGCNGGNNAADSANVKLAYGEHTKDIVIGDNAPVDGELGECVAVVPGTYKLIYISKESDSKYGHQEFIIKVKLRLNKIYDGEVGWGAKLKFTKKHDVNSRLEINMGRGSLDNSEDDNFEKFVLSGTVGQEKEFMFYKSMGNREYADGLYGEVEGFRLWTSGYEKTSSSNTSSVIETPASSDKDDGSSEESKSQNSAQEKPTHEDVEDASSAEDEYDFEKAEAAAEEAEKIDLDLDEFESYVEQYLEYDDRRSVNAIKALGSAKVYSAKLKLKKKKMSSAQLSRYESIKSRY